MKNNILFALALYAMLPFTACDFVTIPIELQDTTDTSTTKIVRKVLLEDYTGHVCTACPKAALSIDTLSKTYGNQLIVVAVHANHFAKPEATYLEDFRTTAGESYFKLFKFQENPVGLINRKDYPTNHIKTHNLSNWNADIYKEKQKLAAVKIEIDKQYDSGSKTLKCSIKSTFLSKEVKEVGEGALKLIVMITQDSIIAPQLNNGNYQPNYVHRHVLRDNINDTWGNVVVKTSSEIVLNKTLTNTLNTYTFPDAYPKGPASTAQTPCKVEHCHIVAFIYNDKTKEVLQVEEAKVIH